MKLSTNLWKFLSVAVFGFILAACGASPSSSKTTTTSKATHAKYVFYVINHGCPSDPFWIQDNNGVEAAAKLLAPDGVNVRLVGLTSSQCGSVAAEVNNLETAIAAHPNGIAVTIVSPTAFGSALKQAMAAGIPVVAYNSIPHNNNPSVNPFDAYVGETNYSAGVEDAQRAASQFSLSSGDTVVVVDHEPTNISLTSRLNGIESVLKPMGVNVQVINTSDNISSGISLVSSYFATHKNVKAIFCLGPIGIQQAVGGLKAQHISPFPPITSFDLDSVTLHYIQNGDVAYTIDQQPFLQGFDAVMELYQAARWGSAPVNIYTGPTVLDKAHLGPLSEINETGY